MKNIQSFRGNCFEFHKAIIKSKHNIASDPDYKKRLENLNELIQERFELYNERFNSDSLWEMDPIELDKQSKSDLLSLYSYDSLLINKLLIELTTDKENRVDRICKNCSIGEVNSFDHYLPQSKFFEYVVNPINLIPSCTKCNGKKGVLWKLDDKRFFLNLYVDILPQEQYLFAKIEEGLEISFFLDNCNNIDPNIFELISGHYTRLELLSRFGENCALVVSELKTEIEKYSKRLPIQQIKEIVIEECTANKAMFGYNYWKVILKMALIESDIFMGQFQDESIVPAEL